jgi:hypothetical protein
MTTPGSSDGRTQLDQPAVENIATVLRLAPDDCLVLTGSRVLPFDTGTDDLDLLVITTRSETVRQAELRRHPERLSEQQTNGFLLSYLSHGDSELDVEVWPRTTVLAAAAAVGDRIRSVAELEKDFTRVGGLEVKVGIDLFQGLWYGRPLLGAPSLDVLRSSVCWRAHFAGRRDTLLVNVRDAVKGIARSLREDRPDEAYLKLCWAADCLADALVFHYGHSIARWKWRLRMLELTPRWLRDWYHEVRFPTRPLQATELWEHRDRLARCCQEYTGAEPSLPAGTPAPVLVAGGG